MSLILSIDTIGFYYNSAFKVHECQVCTKQLPNTYCHTWAQLTIPDHLIFISDDQLGPQVALYSMYPGRPPAGIVLQQDRD